MFFTIKNSWNIEKCFLLKKKTKNWKLNFLFIYFRVYCNLSLFNPKNLISIVNVSRKYCWWQKKYLLESTQYSSLNVSFFVMIFSGNGCCSKKSESRSYENFCWRVSFGSLSQSASHVRPIINKNQLLYNVQIDWKTLSSVYLIPMLTTSMWFRIFIWFYFDFLCWMKWLSAMLFFFWG